MLQPWERKKIIQLTHQGKSRLEVANTMGCSVATVKNVLKPLGLLDQKRSEGGKRGRDNKILDSGFGNP